jgi:hypothetical protein
MRRFIKRILFGTRATGENIIAKKPLVVTYYSDYIDGFDNWLGEFKVSSHAKTSRIIHCGDTIVKVENIKPLK